MKLTFRDKLLLLKCDLWLKVFLALACVGLILAILGIIGMFNPLLMKDFADLHALEVALTKQPNRGILGAHELFQKAYDAAESMHTFRNALTYHFVTLLAVGLPVGIIFDIAFELRAKRL